VPRRAAPSGPDLVAWDVAERVATQALRALAAPGAGVQADLASDLADATARAERLVEAETGLVSNAGPAVARVTDRAGWVSANVGSFRQLLRPVGARLARRPATRRALNPAARTAAGVEIGLLLTWMSTRVLGQYDLLASEAGGVVYYVAPNIAALEHRHGFPPDEFRLWIALHEVTHRTQFTAVDWLRPYFLGLVERGTELAVPDGRAILEALWRAAQEIRAGRNPLAEAGVAGLLASSEQLATLREAQALMTLLEGHSDVVMSRAGAAAVPSARRFHDVLAERRASASGLVRLLQQVAGIEAKLRQYREGEAFVEAVERAGGAELLALVWSGPEMLPTLDEIRDPSRWVARVGGTARAAT